MKYEPSANLLTLKFRTFLRQRLPGSFDDW